MAVFLISFELTEQSDDYRSFYSNLEGLGDICPITLGTILLFSDFQLEEMVKNLSDYLRNDDVLFILNLGTLDIGGINLPECIDDYLTPYRGMSDDMRNEMQV